MKLLISDKIHPNALEIFQKNNISFTYRSDISLTDLRNDIVNYEGLCVRSRTKVTKDVIEAGKNLRIIARIGSGYDNIDSEECKKRNITLINAPDANSVAVAELTVGLIISFFRNIPRCIESMRNGLWIKDQILGVEIYGKTVGILGYGHVGKRVAKIFEALGANVLIHSRSYQTAAYREVFQKSDIVTIHLSLNTETKGCVSKWLIGEMKPSAILMNLSRGKIVDEEALYDALLAKKIRGAILDVYWSEPLPPYSRWRSLDNVLLTPHIGAATNEAILKASMSVAQDLVTFFTGGNPENIVR